MFCKHCGSQIADQAVICVKCGVPSSPLGDLGKSDKSRVAYILLGLFLGGLGIHNFYAGRTSPAVIQLLGTLISLATLWLILPIFILMGIGIWVLVDICTVTTDSQGKKLS